MNKAGIGTDYQEPITPQSAFVQVKLPGIIRPLPEGGPF